MSKEKKEESLILKPIPYNQLSRLKDRTNFIKNQKWVIETIFPCGEYHMLSGSSGVGKTSWTFNTMRDWVEGKDVLGYKSHPAPYLYISCDRSAPSIAQTLLRLGLEDWDLHYIAIEELETKFRVFTDPHQKLDHSQVFIDDLPRLFPDIKVFWIDGISWFLPTGAKNSGGYEEIFKRWSKIRVTMAEKGITIIGITGAPKSKPGEKYGNPRDRVIGSTGQAQTASTVIVIDPEDDSDPTNLNRKVTVLPRNAPNQILSYHVNPENGALEYRGVFEGEEKEDEKAFYMLCKQMSGIERHTFIDTESIKGFQERANISKASMFRCLKLLEERGFIKRVQRGRYLVVKAIELLPAQ